MGPLDVFVDLTAAGRALRSGLWPHPERFTVRARRVTCVVPAGTRSEATALAADRGWRVVSSDSAVDACSDAMASAGAAGAALLILQGPVEASDESLYVLRQCLERDPMFGWAVARTRCARGCCVQTLTSGGLAAGSWIPRRTLTETREWEIMPERLDPNLLVGPNVVGEFGALDSRFASLPAAILHYLSRARRCGYRTVVANRAVMAVAGRTCEAGAVDSPAVPSADQQLLRRLNPDLERGWIEFRAAREERFETLAAHAIRAAAGEIRPSVLLDLRNVGAIHNGTSYAALGNLRALRSHSPKWDVAVLAHPAAVSFHGLRDVCEGWELASEPPKRPFAAALRLSQPWHLQEIEDLHTSALFNAYYMLDTIAWDVVYAAPAGLEGTWSFLAEHADGFLFNSAFTQRRFLARFDRAEGAALGVCHHSFDPEDYVLRGVKGTPTSDYILIVGNEFDHKDVAQTVELLRNAFPFQPLVALGSQLEDPPLLRAHRAGNMMESEIHRLYAGARFIVFPSFYEGFGFPIVTALAYGTTLIARRSEMLDEIAGRCPTGRLIAFSRRDDLVPIVGRLLHGETVSEEPVGHLSTGRPRTWRDVGLDLKDYIEGLVREPARTRWRARESALNHLRASRARR